LPPPPLLLLLLLQKAYLMIAVLIIYHNAAIPSLVPLKLGTSSWSSSPYDGVGAPEAQTNPADEDLREAHEISWNDKHNLASKMIVIRQETLELSV